MNGTAEAIAKSRENLAKLNATFAFLEQIEPRLLAAALATIESELAAVMPRVRAYAIETANHEITVNLSVTLGLDPKHPSVTTRLEIAPPPFRSEKSTQA
jgi:hypothetical protein